VTTPGSGDVSRDDDRDRPMDVITLHEDDLLLDQLGRGAEPTGGGAVAATLSRWRATLPEADPVDDELLAAALAALRPPRRVSRVARGSVILSTAAVVAFGTVTAAAEHAGPNSPLWPLTQLMFHDRAEARSAVDAASDTVGAARAAIDGGHYDEASRLLDGAAASVRHLGGGADADRLRDEIAALRASIPADTEESRAEPAGRVPSSDVPRSVVPPLPTDSLPTSPDVPRLESSVVPAVPPVGPGTEVLPPLVSVAPLLPTPTLPLIDGPFGLVR
jgi:hypothetical protein